MARKKPSLQASLQQVAAAAPPTAVEEPALPVEATEKPTPEDTPCEAERSRRCPSTRAEKKMLVCYVEKETHRALRLHAFEHDITLQSIFEEAMADFLEKHELLPNAAQV